MKLEIGNLVALEFPISNFQFQVSFYNQAPLCLKLIMGISFINLKNYKYKSFFKKEKNNNEKLTFYICD